MCIRDSGDISYQSAREENQQSVFAAMSELYDYFGSETSVQLTIINTPIPEREIGRKRFFEKSDPRVDRYVEEYNRILNDKMREGVSNLVLHRYLTFLAVSYTHLIGAGLYFVGGVGAGKTYEASAIAKSFIWAGYSVVFTDVYKRQVLMTIIKACPEERCSGS